MCSRCQNNVDWIQFFLFQINSSKKKKKKKQEQRQFGLFDNIIVVFYVIGTLQDIPSI